MRDIVVGVGLVFAAAVPITAAKLLLDEANRQQVAAEHQTKADTERTDKAIERSCAPRPPQDRAQCAEREQQAAHQTYHDIDDLEAQKVTAIWTHYMGVAAILGTAFGILGIALVLATFRETRKQAEAAEAHLKLTETLSAPHLETQVDARTTGGRQELMIQVRNSGNSIARRVRVTRAAVSIPGGPQNLVLQTNRGETDLGPQSPPDGFAHHHPDFRFGDEEIEAEVTIAYVDFMKRPIEITKRWRGKGDRGQLYEILVL